MPSTHRTIVIGGGQTGLVVGRELALAGEDFVILDSAARVGDAWRNRWDSLVLFTPARFNGLPGLPFPGDPEASVTKDQMADHLERYAKEMELPIRSGVTVDRVAHEAGAYRVETSDGVMTADNVVIAMANYQQPHVPGFASDLDDRIRQLHSSDYRNPTQLAPGPALVVGLGNSGADIGLEVAADRPTYISGRESGHIPFRLEGWFGRKIGVKLVRFMAVRVLNTGTPIGRRARPKMLDRAAPLVRVKPRDLAVAGAERVPRVVGVRDGMPLLADDRTIDVANVIWCTGFRPGFDWIDLPVFDGDGRPRQVRGVVEDQPGLYFCGLYFQHALWSETVTGVPTDAAHIVRALVDRSRGPVGAVR